MHHEIFGKNSDGRANQGEALVAIVTTISVKVGEATTVAEPVPRLESLSPGLSPHHEAADVPDRESGVAFDAGSNGTSTAAKRDAGFDRYMTPTWANVHRREESWRYMSHPWRSAPLLKQNELDRDIADRVLDSLTAEIAVLEKDGTICAVNEAWRRFSHENSGDPEATGIGVNYLDVCRSATGADSILAESACLGLERVLDGSRDVFQLEYPCHSPIRKRWFLLSVSRLKDNPGLVVTSHVCITQRKLIENQLVEAERLAAIGQTMRGLSHEARNALQRSQSHIDLLKARIESDQESLRLVERIELAQRQLLGLYEEASHYAAPITLNRESCDVAELIKEVVSKRISSLQQVEFCIHDDGAPWACNIDPHAMHQVFDVLIDNAVASGASFSEISCVPDELNGGPAFTVFVSDDGPGVPHKDRLKVFEPFYTTKTRGTGLGLAMSRRIVSAHGGQIYFGTPCRGGASVYITLPVKQTGGLAISE